MDTRSLACFVAVAEELHFRRAAERVFLSQPAFSARIKGLEDEVGVALLDRDRRHVRLTAAGHAFLEPARLALKHADHAATAAQRAARGATGHLRLGFTLIAFHGFLPSVVQDFRVRHPGIALELSELNSPLLEAALASGDIDLGVLHPPLTTPGLATQALADESLVLAVPAAHPLGRRKRVRWAELRDVPLLMAPRRIGPALYDRLLARCRDAGFDPNVVQEATPMTALVGLVAAGAGAGFVTQGVASAAREGVRYLGIDPDPPTLPMALAWKDGELPASSQRFIDLVLRAQQSPRQQPSRQP